MSDRDTDTVEVTPAPEEPGEGGMQYVLPECPRLWRRPGEQLELW